MTDRPMTDCRLLRDCDSVTLLRFAYIVFMASGASKSSKTTASPRTKATASPKAKAKAQVISSRVVFRGPVFSVVSDKVREPGGITARRDVIRHSGSVVILAVDESRGEPRVLLERQYRYAANDYLWELPAGRVAPGEQELAGAK